MSQRLAPSRLVLDPAKVFTWIALPTGLVLVVLTPPFQVPDEPHHFFRAYQVAEGSLVPQRTATSVGGTLPRTLQQLADTIMGDVPFNPHVKQDLGAWARAFGLPLRAHDRIDVAFPNTALAGPTAYFPQSLGIWLGTALDLSALQVFYWGRLFSLLACVGITAVAIRRLPFRRWTCVLLSLLPMTLFVRPSLSSDGPTLALTMLAFALCLRLPTQGNTGDWKVLAPLLGVAAVLAFGKPPYGAVAFLALATPPRLVGGLKGYLVMMTGVTVAFLLAQGAWAVALQGKTAVWVAGADPESQLAFLAENPPRGATLLVTDLVRSAPALTHQALGVLGWLDAPIPAAVAVFLGVVLVLVALGEPAPPPPLIGYRWLGGLIFVVGSLALHVMNYVWWTPPGAMHVEGIQGRHLLPLMPFLLVSFSVPSAIERRLTRLRPALVVAFLVGSVVATALTVINRYYDRQTAATAQLTRGESRPRVTASVDQPLQYRARF